VKSKLTKAQQTDLKDNTERRELLKVACDKNHYILLPFFTER